VQLILGDIQAVSEKQVSLPLGSKRLTERYVEHDPPEPEELETLREGVLKALPEWNLPEETAVVAIGGSARAILKLTRDHPTVKRLEQLIAEISMNSSALAQKKGLAPGRARVLPAAITTLTAVLEHFGKPSPTVARGGIREGAILAMDDEARNKENRMEEI
jgi:exopolyphosphatase/guanosine-5'-triphosphate,3'-diphosphate pyrophosphatase